MKPSIINPVRSWTLLPVAAALALSLSACGGGGGGIASTSATPAAGKSTLTGAVIDAPIANAVVTFTTGAPLGQQGYVVVGNATADANGNYTVTVALPNTTAPLFANATSPGGQVVLTAYLGASSAVLAAGSLTSANLPNLVISQVTTAALAVYVAAGGSYATLTPTLYAALLSQHHDDILALSAAVKAVADGYCAKPSQYKDTDDMARGIAMNGVTVTSSTTGTSSTLTAASTTLGSSCDSNLKDLMQYITSDERWAPELDLGDVLEQGAPAVAAGSYSLQGVLAQSGMGTVPMLPTPPASGASAATLPPTVSVLPPGILNTVVTVDAKGDVSSADGSGHVTGVVVSNLMTLTVNDGKGNTYVLAGKVGLLPAGFVAGGSTPVPGPSAPASSASGVLSPVNGTVGYGLRMGGRTQSGGVLTRFDAVLVPQGSQPGWSSIPQTRSDDSHGMSCQSGQFGVRLMGTGSTIGGLVLGACVAPQPTGLALSPAMLASNSHEASDDDFRPGSSVSFGHFALNNTSGTPYIVSAPTVTITKSNGGSGTLSVTGQMFYVMGAKDMIFSTATPTFNGLFVMNENPLDKLQETPSNQDH
uniref:Bacterial Ig domain-containing protein n=1 Tax=mine drainage metagenome TaxID=410659 RepID=E6PRV3_9ZZZZ